MMSAIEIPESAASLQGHIIRGDVGNLMVYRSISACIWLVQQTPLAEAVQTHNRDNERLLRVKPRRRSNNLL